MKKVLKYIESLELHNLSNAFIHRHMGEYIKNVQDKVKSLDESAAPHCFQLETAMNLPRRLCTHKMSGRTEFTPRANPSKTSIRSLLQIDHVSKTEPNLLYEGEDVVNPLSEIPRGEVDALEIFDLQGKRRLSQRFLSSKNVTLMPSTVGELTQLRQEKDGDFFIATEMAVMDLLPLQAHVGDCRQATACWKVTKDHGVGSGAMKQRGGSC